MFSKREEKIRKQTNPGLSGYHQEQFFKDLQKNLEENIQCIFTFSLARQIFIRFCII